MTIRPKRVLRPLLTLMVLVSVALWVWRCVNWVRHVPEPIRNLPAVSDVTHVAFPQGSTLIDGKVCRCWNAFLYARVRLPADRVQEFWSQPLFAGRFSSKKDELFINVPAGVARSWRVDAVRTFQWSAGGDLMQEGSSQAFVSFDDPANPVLHLYWAHN
jgi:hypothetical protein